MHVELVKCFVTTEVNTEPESDSYYYLEHHAFRQVLVDAGRCFVSRYDTLMKAGYAAHIRPRTLR